MRRNLRKMFFNVDVMSFHPNGSSLIALKAKECVESATVGRIQNEKNEQS